MDTSDVALDRRLALRECLDSLESARSYSTGSVVAVVVVGMGYLSTVAMYHVESPALTSMGTRWKAWRPSTGLDAQLDSLALD
jgi:hypothetical protein